MAKLSVVIPSNEVEVGGVKYRKVDRKAQAGDIVKAVDNGYVDLSKDAYYEITERFGNVGFYDNVDDYRHTILRDYPKDFEVYEKVEEPIAPKYREVKRPAKAGERIRIESPVWASESYKKGDEMTICERQDSEPRGVNTFESRVFIYDREYIVLEPVEGAEPTQPNRLTVGEYAKVVDGDNGYTTIGDIVVITEDDGSFAPYNTAKLDGTYGGWKQAENIVRATESEVEAAKKVVERAKAIGEFADGGYAVIVNANHGNASDTPRANNGAYVKVEAKSNSTGSRQLKLTFLEGDYGYCNADALRKVTKEEYDAATKPKPKFNVGDKVRIVSGAGGRYLRGFKSGDICTVMSDTDREGDHLLKRNSDDRGGYAQPEQLEKISEEELARIGEETRWAAIGRKVDEYKAGDIVKITKISGNHSVGDIGEVGEFSGSTFRVSTAQNKRVNWSAASTVKLLVPVEQRFDLTEGGASPSK